jgi:hypothetical protein
MPWPLSPLPMIRLLGGGDLPSRHGDVDADPAISRPAVGM